jgi:hypothetical protein
MNQATRIALLATMPMLDDADIAPVQRGDQSRVWSSSGPAVQPEPRVVMVGARQEVVVVSQQKVAR